jgi:outer membrane protein assembly factor BamE (lipoprotein component of BamABCDE complex)
LKPQKYHDGKKRGWSLLSLLPAIVLLSLLVGCGTSTGNVQQPLPIRATQSPFQTIDITAIDYTYAMPTSFALRAGLVDLRLVNNGTQPHQAQFARLNPGVTNAQVVNELITQRREAQAFALLTFIGGPDTISPGDGQEAILDVPAGNYVLLCLVTGADGLPHIDKGMLHFLTVSPTQATQPAPQASGNLVITDHSYVLPSVLTRPTASLVKVENQGTEPHEVSIVRLASGKSAQDVVAFFRSPSGAPPFEEEGGMATLAPGTSGWMTVHLEPGNYVALSIIPDPKTGVAQLTQGLLASFTVQ